MANESPYRLGKIAWVTAILLGILSATGGQFAGSMEQAVGSFAGGVISMLILFSVLKFVYVAGKRTLLQEAADEA